MTDLSPELAEAMGAARSAYDEAVESGAFVPPVDEEEPQLRIGDVAYDEAGYAHMRELHRLASDPSTTHQRAREIAREAETMQELYRQFPGLRMTDEAPSAVDSVMARFGDAENTLILDRSHRAGVERGKAAESFVADLLGVSLAASDSPYDMRAANGDRLDVKVTKRGRPLMIPRRQAYKVNPARVDAFVLVWDGIEHRVVGQASTRDFRESHSVGGAPEFPIETMYLPVADLRELPRSWFA